MVKADVVRNVAEALKIDSKEGLFVVDNIINSIRESVSDHQRLEIRDFGVFQIKKRKPRIGRNPKTKEEYPIPTRKVVTFKPGKEIKTL